METEHLTKVRDQMIDTWFSSLKVGDKVGNYSQKWQNKEIVEKKLREGIVKEIHDGDKFNRYVIVDNLTTGRQNKWNDYDLVKPQEIQEVEDQLLLLLSDTDSETPQNHDQQRYIASDLATKASYEQLVESAKTLLKDSDIQNGMCIGIYGAFNKHTDECIYIGKSKSLINRRWKEHENAWKKLRPIHRQPLLTQFLYFFKDQIEWRVLLPIDGEIDNDLIEYCERRIFEQYQPIANTIIPNGTYYGRSVLEGEGESVLVSEWNPHIVTIKIHKGGFNGFSDGKRHFD